MDQKCQINQVIGLMQKNLECVICLDFMKNPVSTKCGHHFCGFCLREFLKTKKSVPCPLCKEPITKRSLVERPHLSEIVDNVRSLITAIQLDTGHFSPERGPQLNFSPSTPEELPTRRTRGSKRKEKETVPSQDDRNKRRRSDATGLCKGHVTQQQSTRSDTTGQGQRRSDSKGHGLQNSDTRDQGQQRSGSRGQGHQRSYSEGQGLLIRNLDFEKKVKRTKLNNCQNLLEEIKTADMKSLTPEIPSTTTGDIGTADSSPEKNQSLNQKCQSQVTRTRQKSSNINQESYSLENKRSKQDDPDTDNLLQYLANESCGAMETDPSKGYQKSQDALLNNIEIHDQSSDEENVAMIYSNVNEEEEEDEEEIFEEEVPVGKDLISLGKEAKILKDKLLQAKTVTFDEISQKGVTCRTEEDSHFIYVTSNDAEQREKNQNLDSKVDHYTSYSDMGTTLSGVDRKKERLEFRPKKKLVFRGKQKPDNDGEEVIQLSGTNLDHSSEDFFSKPVHNVTHTYGSKPNNTKLEKTRMVNKWLKSTSDNVGKVSNNTSLSGVEAQMERKTQTASKNKENWNVGAKVTSNCVDDRLTQDMSVCQDERSSIFNTKRKIFKTKQDHQSNVTMTVQQVKGKGKFVVRKISPIRSEQELVKNKITSEMKSGEMLRDPQGNDPYEFITSQRTPKANKGKKNVLVKKDVKKCKNTIDIKIGHSTAVDREEMIDLSSQTMSQNEKPGSRSSLRSGSKKNIEGSIRRKTHKVKPESALQQKTEDVEKIIEDLNQAEKYDLITCTQEAKDQITEFEDESLHVIVEKDGNKDINYVDVEKESCSKPVIRSLDNTDVTQKEMEIEVGKGDKNSSARNGEKVTASSQKEVKVQSKIGPDFEIKKMVPEKCREKSQHAEQDETWRTQDVDIVGESVEEDIESAIMLSDASYIPNTDDSILSKRTRKLRNYMKSRKSVTFTDKVQHILIQGHNNSQGQTGQGTRGQRSSRCECRGHLEGQSERVTRGQRSSRCDCRGHLEGQSERVTRGQRSSRSETREKDSSESKTKGQIFKENLTQDLQQKRLSSTGTRGQQETTAEVQPTDRCKDEHEQDHSHRDQSIGQKNMDDKIADSCLTNTLPDMLEENSLKDMEVKSLADQSQTLDSEQEVFTELHTLDEIAETDAESIHPCENTNDTVSTQPPSDDIQFGAENDLNIMMTESSSVGKTNNRKKTLSTPNILQDKSPLLVMETPVSQNMSGDCVTLETQESVSLLDAYDWKETEQPDVVVEEPKVLTLEKLSEMEGDSVQSISGRNKRSSPRMTSQSVSSLSRTFPPLHADSRVRPSQNNQPNSGVIGSGSKVISEQHSITISGSTIIPATGEASKDTTQVIQICEVDEEPTWRHNKRNDVKNMSKDVSSSRKIGNTSFSEVFTEEGSQSIKCWRNSRSLRKSGSKDEYRKETYKRKQSKKDMLSQNVQENGSDQDQQTESSVGVQGKRKKDNPCKDGTKQEIICEEDVGSISESLCEKLESIESIDQDDLTPTLKPVDKSHNRKHVTKQGCSPEDIFIMDSETFGGKEPSSIVPNQEGIIGIADFQSLENYHSQITEGKDNSQTQTIKKNSNSQLQIIEQIDIGHNVDSNDLEHSDMETNQVKSVELLEEKMEANTEIQAEKTIRRKWGNDKESKIDSDPDSDLSQGQQGKKTGVRCVRGLATRRRQLESRDSSCHTRTTRSIERDSAKSPGHPTCNQINSERNFTELVNNDNHKNEENSAEIKLFLNDRIDSENQKSMKLKEKFKKTFKKRLSISSNLGTMKGSLSPGHSSVNNYTELQIDKQLPISDDDDDETEKPDIVENSQQKSESDIVIPDSFPCSSKTMKDISSGQSCKSPTTVQTKLSQRNANRKESGDSLKLSSPIHHEVDQTVESVANESPCCDVRRRLVAGRRRRRPVIEESEDEMCDASSPLPDITISRGYQTSKEKRSNPSAIMDNEGEERTEETESEEDGNNNYSSSEESDSSRRLNLTSSSAFSSQSEAMTTQNRKALEKDLERMKREIAELEKQLAINPNCDNQSLLSSKTKGQTVSEDSDSDLVLEKREEDQNDQSNDDQQNDVIDLATISSSFKASQGSRPREYEKHNAYSDESDELFLSPLPPSPPPTPSQSAKKTSVQLPDHILQTTEFLNGFRRTGSQVLLNSQDSVRSNSGSKMCKNKLSQNMTTKTEKQPNKLSSPCGNTSQLKEEVSSPMFESSQLADLRYTGTAEVDDTTDHKNRQSQHRGFITTGLTYLQTREIQKLAQQNNIKFFVKFNSFVTHVIVKTVPPGQRICERTLKFFQGVANQCWVLDYQWIIDCKAAGQLLPEDKYEIIGDTITGNGHYGPRQSRLSNSLLLDGFHFFCLGESESLTTEDLQDLIERCGGNVVDHPLDFPLNTKLNLAVTCIDLEDEDDLPSTEDTRIYNKLYKKFGLLTVSREWILDTLTVYTVQPLKDYVLTTVRDINIPDLVLRTKTS